jgi:hypothetical protein
MNAAKFFQELQHQNLSALERQTKVTRQALHNALKTRNMKLDNLSTVAGAMNYQVELVPSLQEHNVLASLVKYGAPLAHSNDGNLPLELAVTEACKLSRKDGFYESVVPYVLAKNANCLKEYDLVGLAFQNNQPNVLGYFAELANMFRANTRLQKLMRLLDAGKPDTEELLVLTTQMNFPEMFTKNQAALNWKLLVRGNPEEHFNRWNKWEQSQKKN